MNKSMCLLVLVAFAACVFAEEVQDQEAAEQYYLTHGVYPSWYQYGAFASTGIRNVAYPYATYGAGYPYATVAATGVKNVAYPYATVAATGVKNVAYPYATYGAAGAYPYATYGAYPFANAAAYAGVYPNGHVAKTTYPAYNYVY